ncbi:hypothetical protein BH09ACT5_BH09ACT5_14160 [soil metagenome]
MRRVLASPAIVFALLCGLFGAVSVYAQPPMVVNDEIAHFSRAYEISRGNFASEKLESGNLGGQVPHVFTDMNALTGFYTGQKPDPTVLREGMDALSGISINQQDTVELAYSNASLYSPVTYAPQALAVLAGRALDLTFFSTFYLTRFVVLLSFMALFLLAIRLTPTKKWAFTAVGLLPMSIQEAASVSSDALIIGSSALFLAAYLRVHAKASFAVRDGGPPVLFPVLLVTAAYVSLAKPTYFPLFLVALLLPAEAFRSTGQRVRSVLLLTGIPLLLLAAWNIVPILQNNSAAQRLSVGGVGIHPPELVPGIVSLLNPVYTGEVLFHTYVDRLNYHQDIPDFIVQGFFGSFTSFYLTTPVWYSLSVALSLLLAFFSVDDAVVRIRRSLRLLALGALLVSFVGVTVSMFFIATTQGADFINGVQGRYFLPMVLFLLLFLIGRSPIIRVSSGARFRVVLTSLITFNLLFMQFTLWEWFWFSS